LTLFVLEKKENKSKNLVQIFLQMKIKKVFSNRNFGPGKKDRA
jgi:hypothetical protein